jgi:hypothetical protein
MPSLTILYRLTRHGLYRPVLCCLLLIIVAADANAQTHASQWRSSLNSSYATLIGADANGSPIGNYASLDPLAGSLAFKGTIGIGDTKKNRISFLSISAQGDLVNGNFTTAFKNTKLNTNAGIGLEYNFRISRDVAVPFGSDAERFRLDSALIMAKEHAVVKVYRAEIAELASKISLVGEQKKLIEIQILARKKQLSVLDSLFKNGKDFKTRDDAYLEIQKLLSELPKMSKNADAAQFQLDSLELLSKSSVSDLVTFFQKQQRAISEEKIAKIQQGFRMAEYHFFWMTIIAGAGKKDYYTFDASRAFAEQILNPNLTTYKLGFAFNYYFQDNLTKNALMFNLGAQVMKDNNISLLSTQEITQESIYKNLAGDVTRKAIKKYNAYTDESKILEYNQLNIFSNLYYLFAEGSTAVHIFPSFFKPKGSSGYLDTGIGLMFSFKDQKKEKSKLNLEAYLISGDTFNSMDSDSELWDRNEFGVRLTLPFNNLFK